MLTSVDCLKIIHKARKANAIKDGYFLKLMTCKMGAFNYMKRKIKASNYNLFRNSNLHLISTKKLNRHQRVQRVGKKLKSKRVPLLFQLQVLGTF
jgi:hypothetical protein